MQGRKTHSSSSLRAGTAHVSSHADITFAVYERLASASHCSFCFILVVLCVVLSFGLPIRRLSGDGICCRSRSDSVCWWCHDGSFYGHDSWKRFKQGL